MATGPSRSSVTCLNCMGLPLELLARIVGPRAVRVGDLCPIFDFLGGLVHGRDRNICPPSDAGNNARQTNGNAQWKHLTASLICPAASPSSPAEMAASALASRRRWP